MSIDIPHDRALPRAERDARPLAPRSVRRARAGAGRRVLAGVGLVLLAIAALTASAIVHLATDLGREAARDGMVAFLSSRIRGTVHVGEITHLDFERLAMTDFRIDAPDGETVITTDRMAGLFRWGELFDTGTMQLAPTYFDRAEIWLTPGPGGQVNLVHAMEVPDGRWMPPFEMNDIQLIDNILHIELPGKPPVTMRAVNGLADLHVGHQFLWRMDQNRGYTDLSPLEVGFRHMSGRLQSDHAHPLVVQMVLDAEIAEPGARFDYHVPALGGGEGRPYFDLDVPVDIGVSDARDDCAEGDEEHCAAAAREEQDRAEQRERRAPARERAQSRQAERDREHD